MEITPEEALERSDDALYGDWSGLFSNDGPQHLYSYFQCPGCARAPRVLTRRFEAYFEGFELPCPSCGTPISWWKTLRRALLDDIELAAGHLPEFVGVRHTHSVHHVALGHTTTVLLDEIGVPETAILVAISSSPMLHPDFLQGRQPDGTITDLSEVEGLVPAPASYFTIPTLSRKPLGRFVEFHTADNEEFRDIWNEALGIHLFLSWVDLGNKPGAWKLLSEALLANFHGETRNAVVLANTACESQMWRVMNLVLQRHASKENVERFLVDGATYAHQLKVMLPVCTGLLGWPPLDPQIGGFLNRLRQLRNQQVHGRSEADPDRGQLTDLLLAAVFGVHYLLYIERQYLSGEERFGVSRGPSPDAT